MSRGAPYPGMSKNRAWQAFRAGVKSTTGDAWRDAAFWSKARERFEVWWRDFKNARGKAR